MTGYDRHGSEGHSVHRSRCCTDRDSAEEDVADDLAIDFGHERDLDEAAATQCIDEVCFGIATKRRLMDLADGLPVSIVFPSNLDGHVFSP